MLNTILGIVGWVGTALVVAGVAIRFLRPAWDQYAYWAAIAGLACVLVYTLSQWREIARSFARRQTRFGWMTGLSIAAMLGIVIAVNYLAERRNKRWDLTASQAYSLSEQTIKVLRSLTSPAKILVFDQPAAFDRFRDRFNEYEYVSPNVSVEYIDADRQPARARQYQVQSYGTVVLEYQGRTERVLSDTEQELTNGLIKVTTGREVKAYFVQGHGEKNTDDTDRNGYSSALEGLKRDNFTADKLVLAQQPEVPADATLVVIAGPTVDFLPPEIDALRRYLSRAGKVLVMLDPPQGPTSRPLTNLEALLQEWGVSVGHNVVVDVSGVGQLLGTDASVPVAATYPSHPITDNFSLITAYPLAQSVAPVPGSAMPTPQAFIQTSERSWAESDLKSLMAGAQVAMDESAGDQRGPITIALALSTDAPEAAEPAKAASEGEPAAPKPQTRIVVVGDSDFAANNAIGIQGNSDLFANMANWLAQQENLIAIRAREPEDRRITMTADQQRGMALLSLLVIPGLILGSGVYTWWQRR